MPRDPHADTTLTLDGAGTVEGARAERSPDDRVTRAASCLAPRYRSARVLGAGAGGVVFEAIDLVLERRVAVKVVDGADAPQALLREARSIARLQHVNVVSIHEVDPIRGLIVMELAEKGSLEDVLAGGALDAASVVSLGLALVDALAAAHAAGILHRDVKPSNVLFGADGTPRLADFGVARRTQDDAARVGTRAYAAPEQLEGQASVASDLYGLGATLLRAATGKRPHELDHAAVGAEVRKRTGNAPLGRVIERLLEADPDARLSSAHEVARQLRASRTGPRRRWGLAAIFTITVLLVGGSVLAYDARAAARSSALEHAHRALWRNDLDGAEHWLAEADPGAGETASLQSILAWWRGREPDEITADVDRALRLGVSTSERELLIGIRLLAQHRLDDAAAHFEHYVQEHPDSREGLYGEFEALWHRGEGEAAIRVHERLLGRDPDFALGIEHALTHYLRRGQLHEAESVLARTDAVPTHERALWSARLDMARGDPSSAVVSLTQEIDAHPESPTHDYEVDVLARALVARGDASAAREACARSASASSDLARYGIATLREADELPTLRDAVVRTLSSHPTGSYVTSVGLVAIELSRGRAEDLTRALAVFERVRRDDVRTRMIDLLAASLRGDDEAVRAQSTSTSPEVVAAARALVAVSSGRLEEGATWWLRAADASNDGTFRAHELHAAAALYREIGAPERVVEACAELVAPTSIEWGALALMRSCSAWSIDALGVLGRSDEAARVQARWERLASP